ncbi:cytochrome c biogenesis CcdA family protein [Acetohalobium arabaticum]|uniref:Cytochrome c biogenesis protein transmembrane region n=1 Tax=Acetohalobium arabaticum (strain ATCC 49924 / DSM 5501 / Z-7288) TaxID=574087 RepID=D9QSJ1_ACEAZ|nr:cytochrome c biogenesis protein CcdA [Acetohalobium arabaticum]ADL13454.1 cytochrome c biogenesis protein transmembrane region [Acetohalobium arabaticum DSM 5501]
MQEVSIIVALLAGITSFVSPCVLPLVPAYVSYITGSAAQKGRLFTLVRAIGFVIGFSIIFILMGASASYLGQLFARYQSIFTKISGILIIVFGLQMVGILKFDLLYKEVRFKGPQQATNWFSSILMGMAFAAGWTPCVGTVLASILLYAGSSTTVVTGVLLLTVYSLGLGIPFILTAVFINKFTSLSNKINKYLPLISKVSGVVMIIFGILLYLNQIQKLSQYFYW